LRDDTTRFLCAAAHRDEEFADSAIHEYLLESSRSIPRSPGVNAGAVLREAVGARTRRKVRDCVLVLVVLFAANGLLLGPWLLVVAIIARATGARPRIGRRVSQVPPHACVPLALGSVVCAIALLFVLSKFTRDRNAATTFSKRRYAAYVQENGGAGIVYVIILLVLVLLADRDITWMLATKSFRRAHFRTSEPAEGLWRNEWKIRRLGHSNCAEALARYPVEVDEEPDDPEDRSAAPCPDSPSPSCTSTSRSSPTSSATTTCTSPAR
jgi:hypothetical protein